MAFLKIKHLEIRLLSVMIAVLFWIFINNSGMNIEKKEAMIEYTKLPNNLIFIQGPEKITYYLKSSHNYTIKDDIKLNVSLNVSSPGWHTLPVKIVYKTPLPVYASVELETSKIRVFLDKKMFKTLPIITDWSKNLTDYSVKHIRINPEYTLIEGPYSLMKKLKSIKTQPINIYRTGSYKKTTSLVLPSDILESSNNTVSIEFDVYPKLYQKTINFPVQVLNLNPNLQLRDDIQSLEITLQGKPSVIKKLQNNNKSIVSIDLSNYTEIKEYKNIPVQIAVPFNIKVLKQPTVNFTIVPVKTQVLTAENKTLATLPKQLQDNNLSSDKEKSLNNAPEKSILSIPDNPPTEINNDKI